MKESATINIKELARRVPPDYTSESLIIYNHVTHEKAFIGEEISRQGFIVTETCSFSLCTRGEAEIMINTQNYHIKKNHLIVVLPKQVIKPIHTTLDYETKIIFISSDYFKEKCQEMIPLRFKMQFHPVVGLKEGEIKLLESYYSLLSRKTDKLNPHFSELAVHKLAHALFYDLYNFVYRHMQDKDFELSHPNSIFNRFITLVEEYHLKERDIIFYANKLCLTPKYLSSVIHAASGKFAGEWIDDFVITLAKSLLVSSTKTIQEISYSLNFPSPSTFTKFFKRIMKMSPREYRNNQLNNTTHKIS